MRIFQSRIFERKVKKLSRLQKAQLDEAVRKILNDPSIGEKKKGDLKTVFIYKFKIDQNLFLLTYEFTSESLNLIMLGPHENYYRDLKKYLKDK